MPKIWVSILSSLLSLVCTALRGKTKAFTEMEANFKVKNTAPSINPKYTWSVTIDANRKGGMDVKMSELIVLFHCFLFL